MQSNNINTPRKVEHAFCFGGFPPAFIQSIIVSPTPHFRHLLLQHNSWCFFQFFVPNRPFFILPPIYTPPLLIPSWPLPLSSPGWPLRELISILKLAKLTATNFPWQVRFIFFHFFGCTTHFTDFLRKFFSSNSLISVSIFRGLSPPCRRREPGGPGDGPGPPDRAGGARPVRPDGSRAPDLAGGREYHLEIRQLTWGPAPPPPG